MIKYKFFEFQFFNLISKNSKINIYSKNHCSYCSWFSRSLV